MLIAYASARATEPFIASHGRRVRVACELDPVVVLKSGAVIGMRMTPRVLNDKDETPDASSELSGFAGVDRQRVDWSTIIHGLAQLRERAEIVPAVVVPKSYASPSSQRGRTEMLNPMKEASAHSAHGVICEISGIEGAPYAQLQEAVSIVLPLSLIAHRPRAPPNSSGQSLRW